MNLSLPVDGYTPVPLRQVASGVFLEGWLHYDHISHRYYKLGATHRVQVPPPRVEGHVVAARTHVSPPVVALDLDVFDGSSDFKVAAVVKQDEHGWVYEVTPPFDGAPALKGRVASRALGVETSDRALSKYLMQDVHDEPVDLNALYREIDVLRIALAGLVGDQNLEEWRDTGKSRHSLAVIPTDVLRAIRVLELAPAMGK